MITIEGELYSKKNSKQIVRRGNRAMIISSNQVLKQEKPLKYQLLQKKTEWLKIIENKKFPLHIQFEIYRKTHGRFDYINIVQQLLDCMQNTGWLPDDNMNYVIPYFLPYKKDKDKPRIIINILDN